MKKFFVVFLSFLLIVSLLPVSSVKAYDLPGGLDSTDIVTFGVYDHNTGALVESESVEFSEYFLTGLAHSLYESKYDEMVQYNISENDVYLFLQSQNSLLPFITASLNGWLFDVFRFGDSTSYYILCGVRIPSTNGHPSLEFSDGDVSGTYTWEFLPSGSSYFLLNSSNNLAYAVIGGSYPYKNYTQNAVTLRSQLVYYNVTPSVLENPSVSICYFEFLFTCTNGQLNLRVDDSTGNSHEFVGSNDPNSSYYVQYGSGGVVYTYSSYYGRYYGSYVLSTPILCLFPFFYSEHVLSDSDYAVRLDLPPTDVFYPTSSLTNIYLSTYTSVTPDPDWTPGPWITPTPIIVSPVPTAAPGPNGVDPMDGLGQMFNGLLARSYTFEYNGIEFDINPLFFFLGCVFIGITFRIFVGGTHE